MGRIGDPACVPLPWGFSKPTPWHFSSGARPLADPNGRAPPGGELRGLVSSCRFVILPYFLWFSGLFLKHRCRIYTILKPLRSSLRYGHNGLCFVRFGGRLTIQTW